MTASGPHRGPAGAQVPARDRLHGTLARGLDRLDADEVGESLLAEAGDILATVAGLRLDPAMRGRLTHSLREACRSRGEDPARFVNSLRTDPAALQALLDRITVQETAFFRDPGQFECLTRHVLPSLPDPVTVWCAGCANGQEAYSLAMTLAESGRLEWRVIASDVSTDALDRTDAAVYTDREVRALSAERRERFLIRRGNRWEVAPQLRSRVSVAPHNLITDPPPFQRGACAVVFCRNVFIYLRPQDVVAILDRLHRWMPPSGHLFLGFSETLWQVTDRFKVVRLGDAFVYQPAVPIGPAERPRSRRGPGRRGGGQEAASWARAARSHTALAESDLPDVEDVLALGQRAAAAGDHQAAIVAFRQATYIDPGNPLAHLHLGFLLEASGQPAAALRAFAAARAALEGARFERLQNALEGFDREELARLLDAKLGGPA